jgi:pimeloyl-ACP methyl ester carboxylesterase
VAVEIAKKYPLLVRSLVLCSPPFYRQDPVARKLLPHTDAILRDIYRAIQNNPEQFLKISALAVRYGLVNKSYSVTEDDVHSYMGALEASIINQTSLQDAIKIKKPIQIIYGALDAVVIGKNLKYLVKHNSNATLTTIIAGHELARLYVPAVVKAISTAVSKDKRVLKRREDARD